MHLFIEDFIRIYIKIKNILCFSKKNDFFKKYTHENEFIYYLL